MLAYWEADTVKFQVGGGRRRHNNGQHNNGPNESKAFSAVKDHVGNELSEWVDCWYNYCGAMLLHW